MSATETDPGRRNPTRLAVGVCPVKKGLENVSHIIKIAISNTLVDANLNSTMPTDGPLPGSPRPHRNVLLISE